MSLTHRNNFDVIYMYLLSKVDAILTLFHLLSAAFLSV